jgi:hypothetical protein
VKRAVFGFNWRLNCVYALFGRISGWMYGNRTRRDLVHNQVPSPAGSHPRVSSRWSRRWESNPQQRAYHARVPPPGPRRHSWWNRRESNPRPSVCQTNALPTELRPHASCLNDGGATRTRTGILGLRRQCLSFGRSPRRPTRIRTLTDEVGAHRACRYTIDL